MGWLRKEFFNAKLCACHVFVFSYHPLFLNTVDEDASPLAPIPVEYRKEITEMMLDASVKIAFYSSPTGSATTDLFVPKKLSAEDEEDSHKDDGAYKGMIMKGVTASDGSNEANQVQICSLYRYHYEHDGFSLQGTPEEWKLKAEEKEE